MIYFQCINSNIPNILFMFKRPSVPGRPANLCNLFLLEYLANRKSLL